MRGTSELEALVSVLIVFLSTTAVHTVTAVNSCADGPSSTMSMAEVFEAFGSIKQFFSSPSATRRRFMSLYCKIDNRSKWPMKYLNASAYADIMTPIPNICPSQSGEFFGALFSDSSLSGGGTMAWTISPSESKHINITVGWDYNSGAWPIINSFRVCVDSKCDSTDYDYSVCTADLCVKGYRGPGTAVVAHVSVEPVGYDVCSNSKP